MDVADRELRVRTFVEEVWNKRNYDAAEDLYAETYANGFGTGPSARVEPIRRYHDAFPDLRITVEELICSQDTVVLRCAFRGTDTGGYVGRAPTGRAVDEWAVTILHFDGDKVVREWVGADKLGLFIQLGVVEDPWPKQGLQSCSISLGGEGVGGSPTETPPDGVEPDPSGTKRGQ